MLELVLVLQCKRYTAKNNSLRSFSSGTSLEFETNAQHILYSHTKSFKGSKTESFKS